LSARQCAWEMALRVVGGYTQFARAANGLPSKGWAWGAAKDGAQVSSTTVQHVFMKGWAWQPSSDGSRGSVKAKTYLLFDESSTDSWKIVGSQTCTPSGVVLSSQGLQSADRRELIFKACKPTLRDGSYVWESAEFCYLLLSEATGPQTPMYSELLTTNSSGTTPCQRLSSIGRRSWSGVPCATFRTYMGADCLVHTLVRGESDCPVPPAPAPDSALVRSGTTLAAAATIGGLAAIAAPFAVMGVVSALGFGSGGIAAGSTAAAWMSAEAVASGGVVAAGGTVATLQSIGAAGLGAAGVTASAAGGAVGGTLVGGSVAAGASVASGSRSQLEDQGHQIVGGTWVVVTEEWFGQGCQINEFLSHDAAAGFFHEKWRCCRILFNPSGQEVAKGVFVTGANGGLDRIRDHWNAFMLGNP